MFDNLRFILSFDEFSLPNQGDLSTHCFYHFSTSNVLRLRCNNKLAFLWGFQCKTIGLNNIYSDKVHVIHRYNVKIVGSDSKPVAYLDHLLDML